ncbi:MAG: hypothetical protein LBJ11_07480 [Oscillospiraceae bacterium]|nr:hypothetical protein [Oscillospiraceae bacterium]
MKKFLAILLAVCSIPLLFGTASRAAVAPANPNGAVFLTVTYSAAFDYKEITAAFGSAESGPANGQWLICGPANETILLATAGEDDGFCAVLNRDGRATLVLRPGNTGRSGKFEVMFQSEAGNSNILAVELVDASGLRTAITAARTEFNRRARYTKSSLNALTAALAQAEKVYRDAANADADTVARETAALWTALGNLEHKFDGTFLQGLDVTFWSMVDFVTRPFTWVRNQVSWDSTLSLLLRSVIALFTAR